MTPERDATTTPGTAERLDAYLARLAPTRSARVVPLTGDASDHRYFRLIPPDAPSTILAVHAAPFSYEALPFVNVADLLRRVPVPIPTILDHADDLGVLVLEDLGDLTLQAHLGAVPSAARIAWYRRAVDLLVALQERGGALASADYLPYRLAFDTEKLGWELDFFMEHFVEDRRRASVSDRTRAALRSEFDIIVGTLAAEPRVLCHRDFHSRNLMVHRDRLYVIDFQDARMGPDTYDLASLLRDSYVDLSDELVCDAIDHFLLRRGAGLDRGKFLRRLDLMALQRNLKALGTFGYQIATRHNPVYLQYIPRTLRYVRENLARHPRFDTTRTLLAGLIDELR